MSIKQYKDYIENGDAIIISSANALSSAVVKAGDAIQNRHGRFSFDDMIGKPYGSKITACDKNNERAYIYVLHITPQYWTEVLPHRTQIIYPTDIAMVLYKLDIKPGSVVVETGTGSGSLSHSFARSVFPNGHLHTFDFHEGRVEKARKEFADHGLADVVTAKQADATKDGFGLDGQVDAVFFDLPAPHLALPFAHVALKETGGRLCSFSPCIEQVQRTCAWLHEHKYTEIQTIEVLERRLNVRKLPQMDFAFAKAASSEDGENSTADSSGTVKDGNGEPPTKVPRRGSSTSAKTDTCDDILTSEFQHEQKGHTGFLTFATKPNQQQYTAPPAPPSSSTPSNAPLQVDKA